MRKPVRCIENIAPFVPAEPGAISREDLALFLKLMAFTLALGAVGILYIIGRL